METWVGIIVIALMFALPKIITNSKRNVMCDEINYCARNGIKRDINKSIDLSVRLSNKEITQNQYFDLFASGYTRCEGEENK